MPPRGFFGGLLKDFDASHGTALFNSKPLRAALGVASSLGGSAASSAVGIGEEHAKNAITKNDDYSVNWRQEAKNAAIKAIISGVLQYTTTPANASASASNKLKQTIKNSQYFTEKDISSDDALKLALKTLAKQYHPDINPDGAAVMAGINSEYDSLSALMKQASASQNPSVISSTINSIKSFINKIKSAPAANAQSKATADEMALILYSDAANLQDRLNSIYPTGAGVWENADYDMPVTVTGFAGKGADGRDYMTHIRVKNSRMGDKYYGHTLSSIDNIEIEPTARSSANAVHPVNNAVSSINPSIPQGAPGVNNYDMQNAQDYAGERDDKAFLLANQPKLQVLPGNVPILTGIPANDIINSRGENYGERFEQSATQYDGQRKVETRNSGEAKTSNNGTLPYDGRTIRGTAPGIRVNEYKTNNGKIITYGDTGFGAGEVIIKVITFANNV